MLPLSTDGHRPDPPKPAKVEESIMGFPSALAADIARVL
jgi:hypothetical protein